MAEPDPAHEREDRPLPGITTEPQHQEHEHAGSEVGEARPRPWKVREPDAGEHRQPGKEGEIEPLSSAATAHRIGTFTVRVNASNSETRSVSLICQLPPGESTMELRM